MHPDPKAVAFCAVLLSSIDIEANVRTPPMLFKKSLLRRGKSFDSLDYEGLGGFRDDGQAGSTGAAVL
jgi:hypothetical protein